MKYEFGLYIHILYRLIIYDFEIFLYILKFYTKLLYHITIIENINEDTSTSHEKYPAKPMCTYTYVSTISFLSVRHNTYK